MYAELELKIDFESPLYVPMDWDAIAAIFWVLARDDWEGRGD